MGQSVTASGRMILCHQIRKGCEIIDGNYNIDPIVDDEDPRALRGEVASPSLIYGDTDSVAGTSVHRTNYGVMTVEQLFATTTSVVTIGEKEYAYPINLYVATYNSNTKQPYMGKVKFIYRHKVTKAKWVIQDSYGNEVVTTGDHSIMVNRHEELMEIKPCDIVASDQLITFVPNTVDTCGGVATCTQLDDFVDEYVYDLGMEDTSQPWFFANDILVHNSLYCTIKNLLPETPNLDDVVALADKIGSEINDSFPEYNQRAFLCQPNFSKFIKTGRELVADRGFYIQKKRYVIHVVDKEGKRVDTIKAMGVDMRKTTCPRPVKEFLRNVCCSLLTQSCSDDQLDETIMAFRDSLIDEYPLMEIGLPKGIKKIELYTEAFRESASTRLPGHVAAGILYNEYMKENKDTVSLPITSGMKIRVFDLEYPLMHDGRYFKSIALPTDTEEIPQWFMRTFAPKIDRIKHARKLVDNCLHNMFDSIPRHVPTRHQQALNQEFDWG